MPEVEVIRNPLCELPTLISKRRGRKNIHIHIHIHLHYDIPPTVNITTVCERMVMTSPAVLPFSFIHLFYTLSLGKKVTFNLVFK